MIKPALLIEDFSALGQISLIGALSILQAMGITTASLPATILSSQTEGFGQPAVLDTKQWIQASLSHWQAQDIEPSGVLIGYLGQCTLAEQLGNWLEQQNLTDCLKIVDPVMGDQGRLYPGFDHDYVEAVKKLCRHADLITPNWTELCFLAGLPYSLPTAETLIQGIDQLKAAGINTTVIITGVHLNGQIGCCWRQDQQTEFDWRQQQNRPENLLNGSDSHQSLQSNSDCYHKQPLNFAAMTFSPVISMVPVISSRHCFTVGCCKAGRWRQQLRTRRMPWSSQSSRPLPSPTTSGDLVCVSII